MKAFEGGSVTLLLFADALFLLEIIVVRDGTRRRVRSDNTVSMTRAAHVSICVGGFWWLGRRENNEDVSHKVTCHKI